MGKALTGELSSMRTGLVLSVYIIYDLHELFKSMSMSCRAPDKRGIDDNVKITRG